MLKRLEWSNVRLSHLYYRICYKDRPIVKFEVESHNFEWHEGLASVREHRMLCSFHQVSATCDHYISRSNRRTDRFLWKGRFVTGLLANQSRTCDKNVQNSKCFGNVHIILRYKINRCINTTSRFKCLLAFNSLAQGCYRRGTRTLQRLRFQFCSWNGWFTSHRFLFLARKYLAQHFPSFLF